MAFKILVVDDESYMHRPLQHHLEPAGFKMQNAYDGRKTIELAGRNLPNLVVMDLMMAEIDGLSTFKELKATRQETESSGTALFRKKPFVPTRLLKAMGTLLPEAGET